MSRVLVSPLTMSQARLTPWRCSRRGRRFQKKNIKHLEAITSEVSRNGARCSIVLLAEPKGDSAQRSSETKGMLRRQGRSWWTENKKTKMLSEGIRHASITEPRQEVNDDYIELKPTTILWISNLCQCVYVADIMICGPDQEECQQSACSGPETTFWVAGLANLRVLNNEKNPSKFSWKLFPAEIVNAIKPLDFI